MYESIVFGNSIISVNAPILIVAEAGVNHNGNLELALELVRKAKQCGADCVKFQTFKSERIVTKHAPKAKYQLTSTSKSESQLEMLKKLELPFEVYQKIIHCCQEEKIEFLSTPYNFEDVDFLDSLGIDGFKIASGQIIELSFLEYVAKKMKPIFLSTGMANLAEVDDAVKTILATDNHQLVLLQCTTNYPSRIEDANLRVIETFSQCFKLHCGYSDHTQSATACIAAVALGARVIEKHLTLDKNLSGPDHSSSADPAEFLQLVRAIREAETAMGNGIKQPSLAEKENAKGMRRSIVARKTIPLNTIITEPMLTFKRPSSGINPALLKEVVGCKTLRKIEEDEIIQWKDLMH